MPRTVSLQIEAEHADRAYVELPDSQETVHPTFVPELIRVLKKGASICIRYSEVWSFIPTFYLSQEGWAAPLFLLAFH